MNAAFRTAAELTAAEVEEIRDLMFANADAVYQVAARFRVSRHAVEAITRGEARRDVRALLPLRPDNRTLSPEDRRFLKRKRAAAAKESRPTQDEKYIKWRNSVPHGFGGMSQAPPEPETGRTEIELPSVQADSNCWLSCRTRFRSDFGQ